MRFLDFRLSTFGKANLTEKWPENFSRGCGVGHYKTTRKSTSRDAYFANRTKRPQSKLHKVSARTDSDLFKASLTGFLTRAKPAAEELFCQLTLRAPWNPTENGRCDAQDPWNDQVLHALESRGISGRRRSLRAEGMEWRPSGGMRCDFALGLPVQVLPKE